MSVLPDPIDIALAEDIGSGDLTSRFFVGPGQATGRIFVKEHAIAAGVETAAEVFRRVDPGLEIEIVAASASAISRGDTVLKISGVARSILTAERVALNFLQRLSGIATLTRRFVDAVAGHKARILDTRKTTPGLRAFEKAAVRAGGGANHRFGLFDMVMVKDNHLLVTGARESLQSALGQLRADHPQIRVELEADTVQQVGEFLQLDGVDVILLDNMTTDQMREAVRLAAGRVELEASGGVTLETVEAIAATGVDFISVGALTHSAPSIDFSLELRR